MTRDRILQVFLVLVGLLFVGLVYPLFTDLWHAKWLLVKHNEVNPMFVSFFVVLGVFLLLAAKNPLAHRSLIVFTAWWNLAHAFVMTIQTVQAWQHGTRRNFTDVIVSGIIGLVLLLFSPRRTAGADRIERAAQLAHLDDPPPSR